MFVKMNSDLGCFDSVPEKVPHNWIASYPQPLPNQVQSLSIFLYPNCCLIAQQRNGEDVFHLALADRQADSPLSSAPDLSTMLWQVPIQTTSPTYKPRRLRNYSWCRVLWPIFLLVFHSSHLPIAWVAI